MYEESLGFDENSGQSIQTHQKMSSLYLQTIKITGFLKSAVRPLMKKGYLKKFMPMLVGLSLNRKKKIL